MAMCAQFRTRIIIIFFIVVTHLQAYLLFRGCLAFSLYILKRGNVFVTLSSCSALLSSICHYLFQCCGLKLLAQIVGRRCRSTSSTYTACSGRWCTYSTCTQFSRQSKRIRTSSFARSLSLSELLAIIRMNIEKKKQRMRCVNPIRNDNISVVVSKTCLCLLTMKNTLSARSS